jgi:arylsulfatase A-like enzyme
VPTLPETLRDAGVYTSYVGKWHIGHSGNGPIPKELRPGFDAFIGYQAYNEFLNGVCFFDEADREHRFQQHRTDATTGVAIERMRRLPTDRPFVMYVSYQAPHYPEQPGEGYEALHRDKAIEHRPNCQAIDPYTATYSPPSPTPPENDPNHQRYGHDLDEYIRLYNAMCTQVDAGFGRLLDELDRLGFADDTIVIYTSDHGDMQGSHGLKNKTHPYEESAGVPLIVRWPGGRRGEVSDQPVGSVDLVPTILEAVGVAAPSRFAAGLDGRSIAGYLAGREAPPGFAVFSERPEWCLVRDGEWKLVADREESGGMTPRMLFNLRADPYEMQDRLDDPAAAERLARLTPILRKWDQRVRRPTAS